MKICIMHESCKVKKLCSQNIYYYGDGSVFVDSLLKSEICLKCFIFPFPPLRVSLSDSFFACQSAGSSRAA